MTTMTNRPPTSQREDREARIHRELTGLIDRISATLTADGSYLNGAQRAEIRCGFRPLVEEVLRLRDKKREYRLHIRRAQRHIQLIRLGWEAARGKVRKL